MKYYTYIIYSPGFDRYYVGQTADLEKRLSFHNELSEKSYTSKYRPWVLQLSIPVDSRSTAVRVERYIKGRKSRSYIEKLIEEEAVVEKMLLKLGIRG